MDKKKNILITGITGQDGLFLTSKLISINKDVNIYGFSRTENNELFYRNLDYISSDFDKTNINFINTKELKSKKLPEILKEINPETVFNMSGPSSVYESIHKPSLADEIEEIFQNLINSCLQINITPNFFQACSSEMFGSNKNSTLNEESEFFPSSPYAKAKYSIYNHIQDIRNNSEWNIISGIMFNHESEFRKDDYLFMKIINYAITASRNKTESRLVLGSLTLKRDWSYAGDIVDAIIKATFSNQKTDYVLGSGETTSIQQIVTQVFSYFELDWESYVDIDESLLRDSDPSIRVSDPSKIKNDLDWEATTTVEEIIEIIIKYKLNFLNR